LNLVINNKISDRKESQISQLFVYNNELYLGGEFRGVDMVQSHNIIKWNGSVWEPIVNGANGEICSFGVYHNQLYVAGFFDTIGNKPLYHLARWNGNEFNPVGGKLSKHSEVFNFGEYGDSLFVGGHFFDSVGGIYVKNIAKWDGEKWSNFKKGTNNYG